MAASNSYVNVSGPALSLLIYENVRCGGDQEGLLIGEIIHHVTRTISDSHIQNEKTDIIISINSIIPFPTCPQFYNGIGKINEDLKKSLIDVNAEIVGWYSFKPNVNLAPHLRDKLFHKELIAALPHITPEQVVMCLLNSSVGSGGSTHIFNHKFIRYRFRTFEAIPMQVHNLGETHQSEYKLNPSTTSLSSSFNKIVKSALEANSDAVDKSDANLVCHIQRALQEHLRKLIDDLCISEENIFQLEKEVDILRKHTGPLPNEILLPKLLQEDHNTVAEQRSCPSRREKSNYNNDNQYDNGIASTSWPARELNDCENMKEEKEESCSTSLKQDSDPFGYITEVKHQMSQPKTVKMSPESPTRRGRSASRIVTRGGRTGPNQGTRESFPNLQPLQSSTKSSQVKSPQTTASSGYAQALKKPSSLAEDMDIASRKPLTRSQATYSNGPESNQNQ